MNNKQTICITRMLGLLYLAAGLATGACTGREVIDDVVPPTEADTGRREVLLTLNNKLALPGSATRGIATSAENQLSTLDVYVFGSATEGGTYTFQECFSYRSEGAGDIPDKSTDLPLAVDVADDSKTTGLLGLKKGLFVKLYCVANAPELIDPVTGNRLTADDFTALKLNEGAAGTTPTLQAPGVPTETTFLTYHTPLLAPDVATDVLLTPLFMSGAYTTPIDLTDPEGSTRLSIGFKLTRMVARFDVVNKADESRFTVQSISMSKGRRGATFFPITVCDAQAGVMPDKLITYPERLFDGLQANQGLQAGAFYTYASPTEDAGYLILKGLYQVNATEQKEVSYQVPFRQLDATGKETYLEIQHNHRYTIGITKADEYHLDFNLKVEDWADDGSVDDYVPENKPGEITLGNKDADTEYELDAVNKKHTVKMTVLNYAGTFEAKLIATAAMQVTKTYAGGQVAQQYDWLKISSPTTTFAAGPNSQMEYTYTFTVAQGYIGRFPRATVRFFDPISGNESILYVEAISAPTPIESTQPSKAPNGTSDNPNSVDLNSLEVSLYRITDSQANLTVSCADEVEVESCPNWLTVTKIATNLPKTTFSAVLTDRDVADATGKIVFHNVKKNDLKTEYTVNLLAAPIQPKFDGLGGVNNSFTPDAGGTTLGELTMNVTSGNKATVVTTPLDGVTTEINFNGGPEWLKSSAAAVTRAVNAQQQVVTLSLQEDKLDGAKTATVTLVNKIGGKNEVFTVKPQLNVGTIEKVSSLPEDNVLTYSSMTLYKLPSSTSEMKLKVTSYGGSTLTTDNDNVTVAQTAVSRASSATNGAVLSYYTLTPNAFGTTQLTLANKTDLSKTAVYTITVADPGITVNEDTKELIVQNNQSVSFSVTSPRGYSAEANYGTTKWVNTIINKYGVGTTSVNVSTPSSGTVTDASLPQNVTITLKNNIKDGGDKVITVKPKILQLAMSQGGISLSNILDDGGNVGTNTVSNGAAFSYSATSNNTDVATVASVTGTTIKINAKRKGGATITVKTTSGACEPVTFQVYVERSYESGGVWRSLAGNYYMASANAHEGILWTETISRDYCENKFGANWRVPNRDEMLMSIGTTDVKQNASVYIRDTYNEKGIFQWGGAYHTRQRTWADGMWYYYYLSAETFGTMQGFFLNNQLPFCRIRCITDR